LPKLVEELSISRVGLIVLTPDNLKKEWIMFEAGAIFAKIVESARVRPIVFGMEVADVGLPLSYLQCVKFSREGMLKVVKSINSAVEKKRVQRIWKRFSTNGSRS